MSHLVLARKYRPQSFKEVLGQKHVTQTLLNAIKREKIAHAYLLAGPRGVGKTTIARVFSKALNCLDPQDNEPCLKCDNCQEIDRGVSIAVREIDGASHNSVDNVRDLIETFRTLPPPNYKHKVYIIDEVHMLSVSAFNALLKSLEEPPANTVFILATTEPHKILPTVISRCQRFDLRALSLEHVESCLQEIAEVEKVDISSEVLRQISRLSEGSVRDAQSMLEKVFAYNEKEVTAESAAEALGIVSKQDLLKISAAIFNHDTEEIIKLLDKVFSSGYDPIIFLKEFVSHWRELLIIKRSGKKSLIQLGVNEDLATDLLRQVEPLDVNDIHDLTDLARSGADQALRSNYLRYSLESLLLRLATREKVANFAQILTNGSSVTQIQKKKTKLTPPRTEAPKVQLKEVPQEEAKKIKLGEKLSELISDKKESAQEEKAITPDLNWRDFIRSLGRAKPILLEHLRRVAVSQFTAGLLKAEAPELSVGYLNQPVNQEILIKLLTDYSDIKSWQINLSTVSIDSDYIPGSIKQEDQENTAANRRKTISNLMNHSNVKALKEVFPGSEVEG